MTETVTSLLEPRLLVEEGLALAVANSIQDSLIYAGFRLVRVRLSGLNGQTLQIMIEREDGTCTVGDCEKASEALSPILDATEIMSGAYHLEVSSPGMDRPLVRLSDFERYKTHEAKIETHTLLYNRKRFKGFILGLKEGDVLFKRNDNNPDEPSEIVIPANALSEARLTLTEVLIREALRKAKQEEEAHEKALKEAETLKGPGRFAQKNNRKKLNA